jgi:hypothetical protein
MYRSLTNLFDLLLDAQVIGMATFALTAVGCTWRQTSVTFAEQFHLWKSCFYLKKQTGRFACHNYTWQPIGATMAQ